MLSILRLRNCNVNLRLGHAGGLSQTLEEIKALHSPQQRFKPPVSKGIS
jgi:hypothetical protein